MSRLADYMLEIGFGGGIGGRFTFGSSTIGGLDIFATDWTEFFNGPYDDVSMDIADNTVVTWSRGLDTKVAAIESGKSSFTLRHAAADALGLALYDPNEPTSPLVDGTVNPGFVPMRPVRLRASTDGWVTATGLFYHFIRAAEYDPETGLCTVRAEDLLYWLSRARNPVISAMVGVSSSDAVGAVLDAIGFTDPSFRVLSSTPSVTGITFSADGSKTALQLLQEVNDAEQGRFYIDGSGVFHFEDRYARDRRTAASFSFDAELVAMTSKADADAIANRVTVTGSDGVAEVAEDAASIHDYGVGDAGAVSTSYLANGTDLAALILMRLKDPHPPKQTTLDNQDAATLAAQLGLEVEQRLSISSVACYLEQLAHTLNAGGQYHTTQLIVTEAPTVAPFELGVSVFVDPAATSGDYITA